MQAVSIRAAFQTVAYVRQITYVYRMYLTLMVIDSGYTPKDLPITRQTSIAPGTKRALPARQYTASLKAVTLASRDISRVPWAVTAAYYLEQNSAASVASGSNLQFN
jgi:hypothetical protein